MQGNDQSTDDDVTTETDSVADDLDDTNVERTRVRRKRTQSPKEKPSTRRRISFWTGCGLIAAGIAILAWVAWQFWGTNWQSQRRHEQVRNELTEGWEKGLDVVETDFGGASALLRIPRFGKDFVVPVLEGSSDEVLAAGVGHMPDSDNSKDDTDLPGQPGNYILAGHRVTHGEPFADFPSLEAGDEIIIETRTATYTYVLDTGGTDLILPFTATWVLDTFPKNPSDGGVQPPADVGESLITLLTCSEIFHTDNRSIVFGHLEKTGPPPN